MPQITATVILCINSFFKILLSLLIKLGTTYIFTVQLISLQHIYKLLELSNP